MKSNYLPFSMALEQGGVGKKTQGEKNPNPLSFPETCLSEAVHDSEWSE